MPSQNHNRFCIDCRQYPATTVSLHIGSNSLIAANAIVSIETMDKILADFMANGVSIIVEHYPNDDSVGRYFTFSVGYGMVMVQDTY